MQTEISFNGSAAQEWGTSVGRVPSEIGLLHEEDEPRPVDVILGNRD